MEWKIERDASREREQALISSFQSSIKAPRDLYEKKMFVHNMFMDYIQKSEVVRSFRAHGYLHCKADEFLREMYWPVISRIQHEIQDEEARWMANQRRAYDPR